MFELLFGIIHLIIFIIVLIDIIGSNRPVLGKLLWALVVFIFPCLGVILYLLFGRGK